MYGLFYLAMIKKNNLNQIDFKILFHVPILYITDWSCSSYDQKVPLQVYITSCSNLYGLIGFYPYLSF